MNQYKKKFETTCLAEMLKYFIYGKIDEKQLNIRMTDVIMLGMITLEGEMLIQMHS